MQGKSQHAALRWRSRALPTGPRERGHVRDDGHLVGPGQIGNNDGKCAFLTRSLYSSKALFRIGAEHLGAGPEGVVKHLPMECNAFRVAKLNPGAEPVGEVIERLRQRSHHVDRLTGDEVDAIAVVLEDETEGSWICHSSASRYGDECIRA
jgi:hypothetical protein